MSWALKNAPVLNAQEHVLLIALADRADDTGRAAWPSQRWLAQRGRCSDRTVRRHLVAMEERGLLRRGDQRMVEHLPVDRRPVVWDLNMALVETPPSGTTESPGVVRTNGATDTPDVRPDNLSGRSQVSGAAGHSYVQTGRTLLSDKPSLDTSLEPSLPREEPRSRRKKTAHPLPADWKPTGSHIQMARERGVDLHQEAQLFRLHAEANDRRAAVWNAAFSQWLIKARPRPATGGSESGRMWQD